MKSEKSTFVIIDGHAIIHRAYHALPPMTTKDGTIVNAVYGFTSMLLKVMETLKPTHLAVSFDVGGGTFRDEVYEDYKATRERADQDLYDQIPLVYDVVQAFDIPIYEKEGFEADDVIGTIAKKLTKEKNIQTVIVTGDKDLLQLVDDGQTQVYLLRKGISDTELYDTQAVTERFGFGPEYIPDFKALMGDPSDNIPGVRGIGKKIGTDLIMSVGGIDTIYTALAKEDPALLEAFRPNVIKKLTEGKDDAYMSLRLATIVTDVPKIDFHVEDARVHTYDPKQIKSLLQKFEFFSLIKRIPGGEKITAQKKPASRKKKTLVRVGNDTVSDCVSQIKGEQVFACAPIIAGDILDPSALTGFVFANDAKVYFVDFSSLKPQNKKKIFELFKNKKQTLLGHDVKTIIRALLAQGIEVTNTLFDIMIASYVVNSSTRAHDLESIFQRELGKALAQKDKQATLFGADPTPIIDAVSEYGALYELYKEKLEADENKGLFEEIEMALISVLAKMEHAGIFVDMPLLAALSKEVTKDIARLEKNIWKEAGKEFNVASSVQLREVLYDDLGLPTQGIKKGKTGYSTAASELEKLREQHEIIGYIETFRELEKLRNTYIDVLPDLVHAKTKRIHTSFNQTVATTGRLSSSNPNLQNIPIRTPIGRRIREAFIAEPGNVLIAADYSQIELRIVASLAQDKKMLEIFTNGEDIHTATAAAINGVSIQDVTKDMRRAAKEVNFGVLYGMGAFGLASRTGIPQWQAKEFIEAYFSQFSGVKAYLEQTLAFAEEEGYVETLFGRRRYIPELGSSNYQMRSAGERMAINMPVQGTAADLMKLAMIALSKDLSAYSRDEVRMLLQVHDEVVFEVQEQMAEDVAKKIVQIMEEVTTLRVPIEVHAGIGKNWGEIK